MRIRVISLPTSTERQECISSQLNRISAQFSFFRAFEADSGRCMFDRLDDRRFLVQLGRPVTTGEIGCFASHKALWQECAQSKSPMIVLEDDAGLTKEFEHAVVIADESIDEFNFIRLQTDETSRRCRKSVVRKDGQLNVVRYTRNPLGAMGYALSPSAARAFLRSSSVFNQPVDCFLKQHWIHKQILYGVVPGVVVGGPCRIPTTIKGRVRGASRFADRRRRQFLKLRNIVARARFNMRLARFS